MVTIVTVNFNSYDFLDLLVESLELYTHTPYELLVVDNSTTPQTIKRPHVHQFFMDNNIGHGAGLNFGAFQAHQRFPRNEYLMFVDVDCHFLHHNWEVPFITRIKRYDLIGGRGVPSKPIRPACMFMKKELGKYDWRNTQDYKGNRLTPEGYDVAILAYHQIVADRHPVGFLESKKSRYDTHHGEEWCLDDIPLVYHHWSGTWLTERQKDCPEIDLLEDKKKLFARIPWRLL